MTAAVHEKSVSLVRIGKFAIVLLLILITAYAIWSYWLFRGGVFSTSTFDPSAWQVQQTNDTDATCFRGSMANDIKNRVLKPGASRAAVKDLLGQPDNESSEKFEYNLGMCSGLGIDFDSLNIYFDERGVIVNAAIVQH
jgi:hypothetical protein